MGLFQSQGRLLSFTRARKIRIESQSYQFAKPLRTCDHPRSNRNPAAKPECPPHIAPYPHIDPFVQLQIEAAIQQRNARIRRNKSQCTQN